MLRMARSAVGILFAILLLGNCVPLPANDSAAESAAGGIQLRRESRISMEKERLTISLKKVTVEYEFLNTTDRDLTTEIAFPLPLYQFTPEDAGGIREFSDFRVWVDDHEVKYQTEVRAKLRSTDYTNLLRGHGIEIGTFGNFPIPDYDASKSQIGAIPKSAQQNLISLGLTDKDGWPHWSVSKTYHWTQLFPSHRILKVRHEYAPGIGFQPEEIDNIRSDFKDVCIAPDLQAKLTAFKAHELQRGRQLYPVFTESNVIVEMQWVKYILTTANTWKTPIKGFELVVEEPEGDQAVQFLGVGMCWDGEVRRVDKRHLMAKMANFVPTRELAVYYFHER